MKYTFEFIFIPQIINNGEMGFPGIYAFDCMESLENAFKMLIGKEGEGFPWNELNIIKFISKEFTYWFFNFPKPEREPEAIYGVVLKKDDSIYYYTLEKGQNDTYFFCKMERGKHILISELNGLCSENDFKKLVVDNVGI